MGRPKLTEERVEQFSELLMELLNEELGEVWYLQYLKKTGNKISFFLEIDATCFLDDYEYHTRHRF